MDICLHISKIICIFAAANSIKPVENVRKVGLYITRRYLYLLWMVIRFAMFAHAGQVVSIAPGDPHWIGDRDTYNTTEDNDFWLTYMNNDMFNPMEVNNLDKRFELEVMVACREQTRIRIAVGNTIITSFTVPADTIYTYTIPRSYYDQVYLFRSEVTPSSGYYGSSGYKGVHVYTEEPNKKFSCFCYSRAKESGGSSRDATLIIPTKYLGKEYVIQTYPESNDATEFAIVATEDNTRVTITPSFETSTGKPAGVPFTITLQRGQAYLVASKVHEEQSSLVDLSGTTVCATKPIAVFNGNQSTAIPYLEANSLDYLGEQMQPINHWGTDFYMGLFEQSKLSVLIMTAQYDNTHVTATYFDASVGGGVFSETYTLQAGESHRLSLYYDYERSVILHGDKPITCYSYLTSAAENSFIEREGGQRVTHKYGDPANAMLPSWDHRTKSMNFFTKELDPQQPADPQHFYVYLVARTSDVSTIRVDGQPVTGFTAFPSEPGMSYGSVEVFGHGYHTVNAGGDGFVGIVYGMTEAQGWQYTLGYTPNPYQDSLFVTAPSNPMSPHSYHVTTAQQGWYQRQLDEWEEGYERLDTVYICEGTQVDWLAQYPQQKQISSVQWSLYSVTEGYYGNYLSSYAYADTIDDAAVGTKSDYRWQYYFDLPDEKYLQPWQREPYRIYELQVVSTKSRELCENLAPDRDTLRMAIKVNRVYEDTIYRVVCMGDTVHCFYDNHSNQGNLSQSANRKQETVFVADKKRSGNVSAWEWHTGGAGEFTYKRSYTTVNGCDSSYMLKLYVCDTFLIKSELSLCENQAVQLNGKGTWYYGKEYDGVWHENSLLIRKDTTVRQVLKTSNCACQRNPKYPAFEGCDSVFELKIYLNKMSRDTVRESICSECGDLYHYEWPIQRGTATKVIDQDTPGMAWIEAEGVWRGAFSDTLRQDGCDDIHVLVLTVGKAYCFNDTVHTCSQIYNKETMKTEKQVYRWIEHRENQAYVSLPKGGDYYDSCQTKRFHCDSIHHLHLVYHNPYVKVDTVIIPNNQTIVWHGQSYGPYPEYQTEQWLHYYDEKAVSTQFGCDSIIRLDLHVIPTFTFTTPMTLCDVEMQTWRGHRLVGDKCQSAQANDTLYTGREQVYIVEDKFLTNTSPTMDSVYRLELHVYPTYELNDEADVCEGEDFTHEGYTWTNVQASQGTYTRDFPLKTQHECDSLVHFTLHVHPVYDTIIYDTICDTELPYSYADKRAERLQRLSGSGVYDDTIPTVHNCDSVIHLYLQVNPTTIYRHNVLWCESAGPYHYGEHNGIATKSGLYRDTLITPNQYGCDSIEEVYVTIMTTILDQQKAVICDNEVYNHPDKRATKLQGLTQSKTYRDTLQSVNGCDSIIELELTVYPTFEVDDYADVCDGDDYTHEGYTWSNVSVEQGVYTRDFALKSQHVCDSLVHFTLRVHAPFYLPRVDTVCQDTNNVLYDWVEPNGKRHTQRVYQNKVGTVVYWDSAQTVYGCDSVYRLQLTVLPSYYHRDTFMMSSEERHVWEGKTYVGTKANANAGEIVVTKDTLLYQYYPTDSVGTHVCDSILEQWLMIGQVFRDTLRADRCDNEAYTWMGEDVNHRPIVRMDNLTEARDETNPYKDVYKTTRGFDSIYYLVLTDRPTYNLMDIDTVCIEEGSYLWVKHEGRRYYSVSDKDSVATIQTRYGTHEYIDKRQTNGYGCDSIWHLQLFVPDLRTKTDTLFLCESDSIGWQGHLFVGAQYGRYGRSYDASLYPHGVHTDLAAQSETRPKTYQYSQIYPSTVYPSCDSIKNLVLIVNPVPRDTITLRTCQTKDGYSYANGHRGLGTELDVRRVGEYWYSDTLSSSTACDSIVVLRLYVDSVYRYTQKATTCQVYGGQYEWKNENGDVEGYISIDKGDTTIVVGTTYHTIHGCDSTYGMELYVAPIYHIKDTLTLCESDSVEWQGYLFTGREYAQYGKTYDASRFRSVHTGIAAGQYGEIATASYSTTQYGCDSVYHLTLIVHSVGRKTIERRVCQNPEGYYYEHLNNGEGGMLPSKYQCQSLTRNDTILTNNGCDSIITLHYFVDSVYDYRQTIKVCQDTVNLWNWIDEENHSHGWIDISVAKDTSFVETHKTIHGCDSIYGLKLHIAPIYRFDSVYHICENERVTWQRRLYTGCSVTKTVDDSMVFSPGVYYDTAYYHTYENCDSTYYLVLHVHAIYDTVTHSKGCRNEDFIWYQKDHNGTYEDLLWSREEQDTIFTTAPGAILPYPQRDTLMRHADRMLESIHGCDSMSHIHVTIYPSYFFYTDTTICATERVLYRGKYFNLKDTTYTEHYKTKDGCDSIYQLHLHIKPTYIFHRYQSGCDDEYFYHHSQNGEDIVWKPGYYVPNDPELDVIDMRYETAEGCDSVYRYHLTIYPTMLDTIYADICSNETFTHPDGIHTWTGYEMEFDVDTFVLPYDTTFIDAYESIHGCDSIYTLIATVYPAYRHVDYATICDDDSVSWRAHYFEGSMFENVPGPGLAAGLYTIYDSLRTEDEMCDSIYELRLTVTPTYLFTEYDTICADDVYPWRAHVYNIGDSLLPANEKDFFYYDSLSTEGYGCDSVYHLYLHVKDTTYELIDDTICSGERYMLHGRAYTKTGNYKDTTLNEWQCHHFTYLSLVVIPETEYALYMGDICADEDIVISYDYDETLYRDIIEYSVRFDSLGHAQGFEDILHAAVDSVARTIYIPIPRRDSALAQPTPTYLDSRVGVNSYVDEVKYAYLRPNDYKVTITMHNGICGDTLMGTDTILHVLYPSWVTEQHWNDGVLLYNERYNGGYTFSHYQWLENGQEIPGQIREFLYLPDSLRLNVPGETPCYNEYSVRLTRSDDGFSTETCPICPIWMPDQVVPQDPFVSVVPTLVAASHPVVYVLSTWDGPVEYEVYYPINDPKRVSAGVLPASTDHYAGEITLPAIYDNYVLVTVRAGYEVRTFKVLIATDLQLFTPPTPTIE